MTSVCQTTPSNQFEPPENRVTHPRRLQFVNRPPQSDHWKQAECTTYPLMKESFEDQRCKRPSNQPAIPRQSSQTSLEAIRPLRYLCSTRISSRSDMLSPQDFRTTAFNADSSPTESKPRKNKSRYLLM